MKDTLKFVLDGAFCKPVLLFMAVLALLCSWAFSNVSMEKDVSKLAERVDSIEAVQVRSAEQLNEISQNVSHIKGVLDVLVKRK